MAGGYNPMIQREVVGWVSVSEPEESASETQTLDLTNESGEGRNKNWRIAPFGPKNGGS